jgi:hypothetical protein
VEVLEQRLVMSSSRPAAISYNGWLHVFTTGNDGHLYDHRTQDNVHWYWDDRGFAGGGFYSNPAVVTAWLGGYNRLHVYLTSFNGHLYDCWFQNDWHLDDHGDNGVGFKDSDPGVMAYHVAGNNNDWEHVFVIGGPYRHVYDHWWDGSSWHWADRGGPDGGMVGIPAATAYWNGSVTQVHAYITSTHSNLYDLYTNDNGANWRFDNHGNPGSTLRGNPAVATYPVAGFNQLHVLVSAYNGHLYDHWWDGTWHWSDRGSAGGALLSNPAATTYWDGNILQLHVYVTGGQGNHLYDVFTNDGKNWQFDDHGNAGTAFYWDPGVVVDSSNRLHVLMPGPGHNSDQFDHWWDGSWHWSDLLKANNGY